MFAEDGGITYVPYLPATELIDNCYKGMFYHCKRLKKLEVEFDETAFLDSSYPYTQEWLEPVTDSEVNDESVPTFIWNGSTSISERNSSTVPEGWEIVSKKQ